MLWLVPISPVAASQLGKSFPPVAEHQQQMAHPSF
jgi:hypothetical protein